MTIERLHPSDGKGGVELKVSGRLTVEGAAEFKDALREALAETAELVVDLTGLTEMDLSGLQLLCAAHGSAEVAGKSFRLVEGDNEVLRMIAAEAGFQRQAGCPQDVSKSCIWVRGVN
ncbi:STAS domain-containing protein [Geomonas sp.]|uniref:STAS domain-containing protein n=1 Tax=Geomonas sp. TaxID=2651584 RepID=UPI002B4A1447|nr:STAS domain-containing protein [Geomonas sp.]HJV34815.1 STAS domain-containing protein [Geomonas sp.]